MDTRAGGGVHARCVAIVIAHAAMAGARRLAAISRGAKSAYRETSRAYREIAAVYRRAPAQRGHLRDRAEGSSTSLHGRLHDRRPTHGRHRFAGAAGRRGGHRPAARVARLLPVGAELEGADIYAGWRLRAWHVGRKRE